MSRRVLLAGGFLAMLLSASPPSAEGQTVFVYDGSDQDHAFNAAIDLGFSIYVVGLDEFFLDAFPTQDWDLVVIDVPSDLSFFTPEVGLMLADYLADGGRVLLSWWDLGGTAADPLAAILRTTFEVDTTGEISTPLPVSQWTTHSIFTTPNPIANPIEPTLDLWPDDGDRLSPTGFAVSLGGYTPAIAAGEAAIVVGNGGRTIVNGFVYDNFTPDAVRPLLENQMLFLLSVTEPDFRRGDANGDGAFDISDAVFVLGALFVPGTPPISCDDAADANDDGTVDISDAVFTLAALFVPGSPPPPMPHPDCGPDPTPDTVSCFGFGACP